MSELRNVDSKTVASFGDEWSRHDQSQMTDAEYLILCGKYFGIFPWADLPRDAEGFDMGCGSGRWARFVAPRVGKLTCVDASDAALAVARRNLRDYPNVEFKLGTTDTVGLREASQDFGYSLGVLHHIPDTLGALRDCVRLLKKGAPFLLYIYYDFDDRPPWFRLLWKISDRLRSVIWRMPPSLKSFTTDFIALTVYYPLAKTSLLFSRLGLPYKNVPLSFYRDTTLLTMRTDSRDRFGTPLEQRFSRATLREMMVEAGLRDIRFSEKEPYWCAVGIKD